MKHLKKNETWNDRSDRCKRVSKRFRPHHTECVGMKECFVSVLPFSLVLIFALSEVYLHLKSLLRYFLPGFSRYIYFANMMNFASNIILLATLVHLHVNFANCDVTRDSNASGTNSSDIDDRPFRINLSCKSVDGHCVDKVRVINDKIMVFAQPFGC